MPFDDLQIDCIEPPVPGDMLERISHLRVTAWQEESGLQASVAESGHWSDEFDPIGIHWTVTEPAGDELLGAARLTILDSLDKVHKADKFSAIADRVTGPVAEVSRLVLRKPIHGRGLWRELDQRRIARAREAGAVCVVGLTGRYRIEKLRSHGFEVVGDTLAVTAVPGLDVFPVCLWL